MFYSSPFETLSHKMLSFTQLKKKRKTIRTTKPERKIINENSNFKETQLINSNLFTKKYKIKLSIFIIIGISTYIINITVKFSIVL